MLALLGAVAPAGGAHATAATPLTPAQLAGQRTVFGFTGTTPPAALVARIRRGEAGAVLLLGDNVPSRAAARALIAQLQAIPRPAAVDEPLLVMIDQEGGEVRRLQGPPARSAAELGAAGPAASRAAGRAAGRLLHAVGADVDLAPVADVAGPGSFLAADGRTFGTSPGPVARAAVAFAAGLRQAGVLATAKHFPGLGSATSSTDLGAVRIGLSATRLRAQMRPFAALVAHRVPLVMLATATYTALDPAHPAALSPAIATTELRGRLGFRGVTVTDALDTPALAGWGGPGPVAVRAAAAGADMVLDTGFPAGRQAADAMAAAIASGRLPRAGAEAAVGRILSLRARLR